VVQVPLLVDDDAGEQAERIESAERKTGHEAIR
jgi:hypothetical protein